MVHDQNKNVNFNQPTPTSFIDDLNARVPEAWERLFTLYGRLIIHWLVAAGVSSEEERHDMMTDIAITVMDSIGNYHKQPYVGSFRSWLRKIVEHHIQDCQRKYHEKNGAHGVYEPDSSIIESPNSSVLQTILRQEREEERRNEPQSKSPHALDEDVLFAKGLMQVLSANFSQRDINIFYQLTFEKKNSTQVGDLMNLKPANVRKIRQRVNDYLKQNFGEFTDIQQILNAFKDEDNE